MIGSYFGKLASVIVKIAKSTELDLGDID